MKIYPASKTIHLAFWQALRAAGVPIKADWIDWQGNESGADPTPADWRRHWDDCVAGAAACDILLLYMKEGENNCGALIEAGAALAAGKRVYAVMPEGGCRFATIPTWQFSAPWKRPFGRSAGSCRVTKKRARHLEWKGNRLRVKGEGASSPHVEIVQDITYPTMWRVKLPDGRLSDMVNITRAKDAAKGMLLAILDRAESPAEASLMRPKPPASLSVSL